jgi:hypothetical protein
MKDLWLNTYLNCQDVSICKLACYVHRPQWFLITEVLRARYAFSKWFTFSTHLSKLDPSKELSACDYKRKINSRINLWSTTLLIVKFCSFYQESYFFCLYPHNIWSPWCGYQQLATYLEKQPVLLEQAHVDFIWVGTHKECTLHVKHMMCPSSLLILFLLDIIKHILGVNQGFFLFFFLFFDIKSLAIFLWKNHKLIQIHTRKSKVWNYIFWEKKTLVLTSALSMYSTNLQSLS